MLRRLLLGSQTALAVLLLVGAGLLGRSFVNLMGVDPGYSPAGVMTARVFAPENLAPERIGQFMSQLTARLGGVGGVVAAGAGNMMPFNESTSIAALDIPASLGNGHDVRTRAAYYIVTPGYAEALGLRLRAGRFLDAADVSAPVQHVVVNDEFVREYLSPDRVVGLRLPARRAGLPPMEIVGVVAAQRKAGNDQPVMAEMYVAATAAPRIGPEIDVVVKTVGDPGALGPVVRQLSREVDAAFVIDETVTLDRRLADSVRQPRLVAAVLTAFASVALVLAAVGVYGVLSYSVSQRARELAVRSALGAARRTLLLMVIGEGLAITAVGGGAGLAVASVLTQLMSAVLFGVTALDPVSFLLAPAALLPVAAVACLLPAVAAARTDPAVMLRQ
jgi:putative ABC transport system permease protein